MPQFLIERNFAEQLDVSKETASTIKQVNDELSLRWVFSFLSADKKKTYCLYEAPSAEAIREAAPRSNPPADLVIQLAGGRRPPGVSGWLREWMRPSRASRQRRSNGPALKIPKPPAISIAWSTTRQALSTAWYF